MKTSIRKHEHRKISREEAAEQTFYTACNIIMRGYSYKYMPRYKGILKQDEIAQIWNFALNQICQIEV